MSSSPQRRTLYTLMAIPEKGSPIPFDRPHHHPTSPILSNPFLLAFFRLSIALYLTITVGIVSASYVRRGDGDIYLSYFTNLSYIGLCAYFWSIGLHTVSYALRWQKNGAGAGYALQSFPRPLQALHMVLQASVLTFPFIVTAVYWSLIGGAEVFEDRDRAFQGSSVHILNALFAALELVFTNIPPPPFILLPFTIVLLALYLGLAYLTYATAGIYTYTFLNPSTTGPLLGGYITGILAGQCLVFTVVHGIAWLRWKMALKHRRVISFEGYPRSTPATTTTTTTSPRWGSREGMICAAGDVEEGGGAGKGLDLDLDEGGGGARPEMGERSTGLNSAITHPRPRPQGHPPPPPTQAQAQPHPHPQPQHEGTPTQEGTRESTYGLAFGGEEHEQEEGLDGGWEEVRVPPTVVVAK